MRQIHKDILLALTPILAGFGLAAVAHKVEAKVPASVTTVTHGAIPKL